MTWLVLKSSSVPLLLAVHRHLHHWRDWMREKQNPGRRERDQSLNIDNIDHSVVLVKLPVYQVVQTAFVSVMSFLDHPRQLQRQRRQLRQPTSLPDS